MAERVFRSTRHPKLPDTFERLRAQAQERKTTDPVPDWLEQTSLLQPKAYAHSQPAYNQARKPSNLPPPSHSVRQLHLRSRTVNTSPLQPTHGNRLPHPHPHPPPHFPPTYPKRKRKMPDSPDSNPRQSARNKKNIQSTSIDDGTIMEGKEGVTTRVSRGQRKAGNKKNEVDVFDVSENAFEDGGPSSLGNSMAVGRRLGKEKGRSNESVFGKGFVQLAMPSSTPSKTPSSPSKPSGSPSKGLITVDKRERMIFMDPRTSFQTLIDTKKSGHLTGKVQKLWQHMNWHERRVIPSAFKVRLMRCHQTLMMLTVAWSQKEINKALDTPDKTKPLISDDCFGALQDRYAADDYTLMRLTTADVLDLADEYRHSGCTEAHWNSIVVNPLLNLVRRLKRYQRKDSKLSVLDL